MFICFFKVKSNVTGFAPQPPPSTHPRDGLHVTRSPTTSIPSFPVTYGHPHPHQNSGFDFYPTVGTELRCSHKIMAMSLYLKQEGNHIGDINQFCLCLFDDL